MSASPRAVPVAPSRLGLCRLVLTEPQAPALQEPVHSKQCVLRAEVRSLHLGTHLLPVPAYACALHPHTAVLRSAQSSNCCVRTWQRRMLQHPLRLSLHAESPDTELQQAACCCRT